MALVTRVCVCVCVCVFVCVCLCVACVSVRSGFALPLCEPTAGQGPFVAHCARHIAPLPPRNNYALVQATVGTGTVLIWDLI